MMNLVELHLLYTVLYIAPLLNFNLYFVLYTEATSNLSMDCHHKSRSNEGQMVYNKLHFFTVILLSHTFHYVSPSSCASLSSISKFNFVTLTRLIQRFQQILRHRNLKRKSRVCQFSNNGAI